MVSYQIAQKRKVRVTLELEVFEDFDARQIDWEKLLDIQGGESLTSYVEDSNIDW